MQLDALEGDTAVPSATKSPSQDVAPLEYHVRPQRLPTPFDPPAKRPRVDQLREILHSPISPRGTTPTHRRFPGPAGMLPPLSAGSRPPAGTAKDVMDKWGKIKVGQPLALISHRDNEDAFSTQE